MNHILRKTKVYFKPTEVKLSYNISSVMQGVLMDKVSYGFGEKMHKDGMKPYSQYFYYENDIPVWTVKRNMSWLVLCLMKAVKRSI